MHFREAKAELMRTGGSGAEQAGCMRVQYYKVQWGKEKMMVEVGGGE